MMLYLHCMILLIIFMSINRSIIAIESTTQSLTEIFLAEAKKLEKIQTDLEKEENELKLEQQQLERDKQIRKSVHPNDVIELNVASEIIATTRQTLTTIPKSTLFILFNGRWEHKLPIDDDDNIRLDYDPTLFRHLLEQLQTFDSNNPKQILPPSQGSLVKPFKKMLIKLGLHEVLSSEKKNVLTFNVGGQLITNRRTIFSTVSNSTFDIIVSPSATINISDRSDVFVDHDPNLFRYLISQLRSQSFSSNSSSKLPSSDQRTSFRKMLVDLNIHKSSDSAIQINWNTKWMQNGITVAGGNKQGGELNQLNYPYGMRFDDDDQSLYVVDEQNHRIVQWKSNATHGQIIAGGYGQGNQIHQLSHPSDILLNKKNNSLIIADWLNRRIVEWTRRNLPHIEVLLSNIRSYGLALAKDGSIYISSYDTHEVKRWKVGDQYPVIVAGGNGKGNHTNQLNNPRSIFVDEDYSLYITDDENHRVMKWIVDAKEGVVVAGGNGKGKSLNQLFYPRGLLVDQFERVYVADCFNDRVVRWNKNGKEGVVIVGGNGDGNNSNQFNCPNQLTFDSQGNLYVIDRANHRIQKFPIETKP